MPRYEYRPIGPKPEAEKAFLEWIQQLDTEFANPDPNRRSDIVHDALCELYDAGDGSGSRARQTLTFSLDPRNATLEPEYYGDVDAAKYAERKPLIWFWMMYDRSPI